MFLSLAKSLSQQPWTPQDITLHLAHRLPKRFEKVAAGLAKQLTTQFPGAVAPDAAHIASCLKTAPILRPVLKATRRNGATPAPITAAPSFLPAPAFADLDLPVLTSPQALAEWLALPPEQLVRFSDLRGLSASSDSPFAPHYRHHFQDKKDGQIRLLEEPRPVLKRLQRRILTSLLNKVPPHPAAHGFRSGHNCQGAAARHAGEAMVICFDLAGFFASIAQHRVYGLFRTLGYPRAVARHLTGLCTALTPAKVLHHPGLANRDALTARHLPQGAPTSPALANLIAYELDTRLAGLARSIDATFTRYADDLTFSGDRPIAHPVLNAVPQVVQDCGFALNPDKTRLQPAHKRQTVTGLVVNQHLNLPRPAYDHLKSAIHHLRDPAHPGRADRAYLEHLAGRITWLETVNPTKGAKLRARLAAALGQTPSG